MSEENTGFWSTVCSIFSISKNAVKVTNQAITEFSDYTSKSFNEWRVTQAEEWCQKQDDPIIHNLGGGFAIIAYEYYHDTMMYIMHKSSNNLKKALENKAILPAHIVCKIDEIVYSKHNKRNRLYR